MWNFLTLVGSYVVGGLAILLMVGMCVGGAISILYGIYCAICGKNPYVDDKYYYDGWEWKLRRKYRNG